MRSPNTARCVRYRYDEDLRQRIKFSVLGWAFAVCAARKDGRALVRNQIDILGHSDERDLLAVHGEVDPLRHAVLVPDHVLRQLVLDVALDGPAQRTRTGV